MGHKNKKSLIWQTQERLDSMLAIGQSKYEDKKLDLTERKIYSWNTYKSYLQHCCQFVRYCRADAVTAHCKGSVKHRYLTDGGEQELKVIPEGDIYRLTVRSKLPSAEKYEKFTEKFADNPDIDQQEIDDQWKEEKEELEADFKDDLKDLLKEEEERLIEYYSDDLD